ncbi:hypothetical protein HPB52_005418 [Rhipicephalus sanguineus]|uniref:HTH OST-type domain-containing protein n=1 Tax=Rhipicephalus sanguineus TaxID=34632 RepID=A0A9D4QL25_RHISA|nr:hypothetical protein HPB52_005418 [Rhipicephalus sanguineus]
MERVHAHVCFKSWKIVAAARSFCRIFCSLCPRAPWNSSCERSTPTKEEDNRRDGMMERHFTRWCHCCHRAAEHYRAGTRGTGLAATMSRGDELETVKAVIRALLIARKRPMPLRRFLLTFIESEGHVLPYARFGFSDPLSFLRSIPDAAQVSQLGSDVYVRATVTDDIEHVRRLVRGQREPNFKSMRLPPAYKRPDLFPPVQSMAFSPSSLQNFSTPRYTGALDPVKANLGKGSDYCMECSC